MDESREGEYLSDLADEELEKELKRRGKSVQEFRVVKGKKEGVVVVWPPSRSRFPLSAKANTWIEILDNADKIRDFISGTPYESEKKKAPKKKKKKKRRKE